MDIPDTIDNRRRIAPDWREATIAFRAPPPYMRGHHSDESPVIKMVRFLLALGVVGWIVAATPAFAGNQYAQYYPPGGYYSPPPPYGPPPCQAVTPGPFRGAARGAAGGAVIGAISGNAGRGAAIGATVGGIGGAIRRGTARSAGACY